MRIAITHPYSWPEVRRGAERIVVETSRALAARGHEVVVFTAGSERGRLDEDGVVTVRFRRLTSRSGLHERIFATQIVPYLLVGHFDVVHAMMPWDAYAAIAARRFGRYRVVFDDMAIPYLDWIQLPVGRARLRIVRDADVYGCMSDFALTVLARDWGRHGSLLPGGVRMSEFFVAPEREPVPTVLFSAALSERHKGLPLLLEAVDLLAHRVPEVRLWLSGPGDPSPFLVAAPTEARRRAEILPLGGPHEQASRYGRAWVTALPSTSEPFGLVLVESLACGTPIVVLDDASPPSLVTPDTGAIAKPEDPQSLATALERALELARKPGTASRCRSFAAQYDWDEQIAPLLESLYTG